MSWIFSIMCMNPFSWNCHIALCMRMMRMGIRHVILMNKLDEMEKAKAEKEKEMDPRWEALKNLKFD